MQLTGRTVLVTGGNTGIGRETVRALAGLGATVVLTARDPAKGLAAVADVDRTSGGPPVACMVLDLASLASVRSFAAEFLERYDTLHVLVNNAGLVLSDRRETAEGFEMTFGVNHLGPFLLTDLLLDRLRASAPARIVTVSSDAHRMANGLDFDDLQATTGFRGMSAYARSKLANLWFTTELARRLEGSGVTANAVHPGVVRTAFGRGGDTRGVALLYRLAGPFMRTPARGARTTVYVASAPELEGVSGCYFADSRPQAPSPAALDPVSAARLWAVSEDLVATAGA